MTRRKVSVYFVLGEASGDALGADLMPALEERIRLAEFEPDFHGLAGPSMQALGMASLFDIEDIAVMGISAVIARLPKIVRRVHQTVDDIVARAPDVVVLIDSPDFTHAVARRVRRKMPDVPIIDYVCPSVWAWRSGRARPMRAYIDHVLAILPFEPEALAKLGGPSATYIGHSMARRLAALPASESPFSGEDPVLLVLPGSRASEIKRLLQPFGETLDILRKRGVAFQPVLPAVGHLRHQIEEQVASWNVQPQIVDSSDNERLFPYARAALAASGTVALELALHKVPMATAYKLDAAMTAANALITIWSSNLPNLIVDRVLVPEEFNRMVRPERMARYLEELLDDSLARQRQLEGFDDLAEAMKTPEPPAEMAADIVLQHIKGMDA